MSSRAMAVDLDVAIPMRDGVRLSGDVYRDASGEPRPALIYPAYSGRRHPRTHVVLDPIVAFERGYATVVADIRGTFRSEGDWHPFYRHAEDGYDLVEWAASQDWCNGIVGAYGSSGMGVTVARTAVAAPPHLGAAMIAFTGGNYFQGWSYTSGVFELAWSQHWERIMEWMTLPRVPAGDVRKALEARFARVNARSAAAHLPLSDSKAPAPSEALVPWYYELIEHAEYDDYWKQIDNVAAAGKIACPVLQVGGWYDLFVTGQLELARALLRHRNEKVRSGSRLIVGPWAHSSYYGLKSTSAGQRDFGPTADSSASTLSQLTLDFFDQWLRGQDCKSQSTVRYFLMGTNSWKNATEWPPPGAQVIRFYLHSGGHANTARGDGALAQSAPDGVQLPDSYRYDPMSPVPTLGGPTVGPEELVPPGIQNQASVEARADVLVYTSPLLANPMTVVGAPIVTIFAATSAIDTDFTVKLTDVDEKGDSFNVSDGIARLRNQADTWSKHQQALGETFDLQIRMDDVAHVFQSGHRLRLQVSSSNFPRFARNLNSRIHPHDATSADAVVAIQTVVHDAAHPSHLALPVVGDTGSQKSQGDV